MFICCSYFDYMIFTMFHFLNYYSNIQPSMFSLNFIIDDFLSYYQNMNDICFYKFLSMCHLFNDIILNK